MRVGPGTAELISDLIQGTRGRRPGRAEWRVQREAIEVSGLRSTPAGLRRPATEPAYRALLATFGLGLKATGLWRRGVRNALDVRLRRLDLEVPGLPRSFDGYRILQIADPHFDACDGLAEAIIGPVRGLRVDLCALTGDFRLADDGPYTQILEPLATLLGGIEARDGAYAVLGNHDCHQMAEAFEGIGLPTLVNESVTVERGGARMTVTGTDDVNRFHTPAAEAALAAPSETFGPEHVGVALVHSPEMACAAARHGYALYLSGHTHGGQIALPGGVPVITRLRRHRRLARGVWRRGGMIGYTSPGAGVSGLPVRFFTRGEVTLITLCRPA